MHTYRLSLILAISSTGASFAYAEQPLSLKPKPRVAAFDAVPLSTGPAIVKLTEIYPLLASASADVARAQLARRAAESSRRAAAIEGSPDIALVDARRIDHGCLAVHEQNQRQVEVSSCNDSTNQKWYWAADRINSKYNGGDSGWRLFVDQDSVKARIDPQRQQVLPDNPNHVLLNPWSTYPSAPVAGATIPVLSGIQTNVHDNWVRSFKATPATERWEPVALRQYKERSGSTRLDAVRRAHSDHSGTERLARPEQDHRQLSAQELAQD